MEVIVYDLYRPPRDILVDSNSFGFPSIPTGYPRLVTREPTWDPCSKAALLVGILYGVWRPGHVLKYGVIRRNQCLRCLKK